MRVSPACLAAVLVLAALTCSCDSASPAPPPGASAAASAVIEPTASSAGGEPSAPHFKTTSAKIAVGNLDAQISGTEKALARRAGDQRLRRKLVDNLLTRASHLGTVDDYDVALRLAEEGLKAAPDSLDARVLRADVLATLHRFEEAEADLAAMEAAKGPLPDVTAVRYSVAMGRGDLATARELAKKWADDKPDIRTIGLYATVLGRLGETQEADVEFTRAEASYRNVTPFPLAWLYFQWGSMWEAAGELKRGEALYRRGQERLPQHAHTAAHLALLVPPKEGIALLERVVERSSDPEYVGLLARLYEVSGDAHAAKEALAKAKQGFDALLVKHPLAFADHAARFYLRTGDLGRARAVALENLRARPASADALTLWLDALGAEPPSSEECAVLTAPTRARPSDAALHARAEKVTSRCATK